MTDDTSLRMTSHRPYLLRALYAWIADNGMTPYLLVDATRPGVRVPPSAINAGRVVLNIAERAVAGLDMGNEIILFTARFNGVSQPVRVPMSAVLGIYARETGHGMGLPDDIPGTGDPQIEDEDVLDRVEGEDGDGGDGSPPPKRGSHLRVIK